MAEGVAFTCDAEVEAIGLGLLDRTLPKREWTHEGHFAAAMYLLSVWGERRVLQEMPGVIRAYNEVTGVANTDTGGFHATITEASVRAAAEFLRGRAGEALFVVCNGLLGGELGERDWMLRYWSAERLFSVEARRGWVAADLGVFEVG